MNRQLIIQMWNERRQNIALWLELFLVSIVLWFVVDFLYVRLTVYYEPLGYDISHTYRLSIVPVPQDSPDYHDCVETYREAKHRFLTQLEKRSDIEAIGFAEQGIHYSGSRWSIPSVQCDSLKSDWAWGYTVSPGYLKVFRIGGARGESPEEMAVLLNEEGFLAGENLFDRVLKTDLHNMVNHFFVLNEYQPEWQKPPMRLLGVMNTIRRDEFTSAYDSRSVLYTHKQRDWEDHRVVYIRVKAKDDHDFIPRITREMEQNWSGQNLMFSDVIAVSDLRYNDLRDVENDLRNHVCIMAFLLLNVFLGLLGTFWYRTQRRRSEIALHIAMGSNRKQVLVRLLSEGLILLVAATLVALPVDYLIARYGFTEWMDGATFAPLRLGITVGIAFLWIGLMLMCGILFPAYKMMQIRPAEALHEE